MVTNDITTLPAFKISGEFSITNSLKFGFFSVLSSFASRIFFTCFFSCSFVFFKKEEYDEYFA